LQCPNCGSENPEGRRYCEECGEKLVNIESAKERARRRSRREAARYRIDAEKKGLDADEAERRMRRSRRRSRPWMGVVLAVALLILIMVIILIASGGKSEPEKAVLEFYDALRNKDLLKYLKHTNIELYKMAINNEYEPDPYSEGLMDYDSYVIEDLGTRLVKEDGDYAEVEVVAGFFEGVKDDGSRTGGVDFSQYPRLTPLVKIDDTWILSEYYQMKLPYPLPEVESEETEFPEVEEPS
jgi:predicted nucleic acid-binding Zn ribbon protein